MMLKQNVQSSLLTNEIRTFGVVELEQLLPSTLGKLGISKLLHRTRQGFRSKPHVIIVLDC